MMEYELIDISFELDYGVEEDSTPLLACDEEFQLEQTAKEIEYDADGIPKGTSIAEIQVREKLIKDFLEKWGKDHPERKVFNQKLEDYIHIKNISVIEAKEHSAKNYLSTRAVMKIEDVLKNASPIKRVPVKLGDRNQEDFDHFLVMLCKYPDLGSIKLTIGVRKRSGENIQYGVSVLKPGEPLVDYSVFKRRKKKRSS